MNKFQAGQFTKSVATYAAAGTVTIDAWLYLANRADILDVPLHWYFDAPVAAVGLIGIPISLRLAERTLTLALRHRRAIEPVTVTSAGPTRKIPFTRQGVTSTLFASTQKSIFEPDPGQQEIKKIYWRVPVETPTGENIFTISEAELRDFLEVAYRRKKHQFSRNFWTKKRRPPLLRPKYDAFMRLLNESGLIEGRHVDGRASGRLVIFPREALMFLKYESRFAG